LGKDQLKSMGFTHRVAFVDSQIKQNQLST
jgi:hypothetical protein